MYCNPELHAWVRVTDGPGYHSDYDTQACVKCGIHSGVRKPKPWAHPDTMIGRA